MRASAVKVLSKVPEVSSNCSGGAGPGGMILGVVVAAPGGIRCCLGTITSSSKVILKLCYVISSIDLLCDTIHILF